MERRQIRELIGRFLHNDVPGELQTQFRRWMLQPGDGDEKKAALREEWTAVVESPAAADRSEELQRLRHTIRMREAQQRRSRIFRRIRYAAAAAAVLLFAVGEYYYVRSASAVPAEIRLLTARGSKGEFQLPDGTKVWLNASSRLTYPETFDRRERRVTLEGEAYFEVARNTSHPFVVDMNRMEIEVLGTTFDARYERTSGIAETTLNSGSICVRTSRSQQSVRLRPDERLVFNETSGSMIIEQVNASNYNSWIQPTPDLLRHDARRHHHQPRTLVQRSDRHRRLGGPHHPSVVPRPPRIARRDPAGHLAHHGTAIHTRQRVGHVPHRTNHPIKIT